MPFWGCVVGLTVAFILLFGALDRIAGHTSTLVLYPFFFWALAATCAKRLHDTGRSAWWLLAAAIPVLGVLWLFFVLGFRRGTPGGNRYGHDPLAALDYQTVS